MSLRENSKSCSMVDAYVVRKKGYFGQFGGQYVPETLMPALHEFEAAYDEAKADPAFQEELESYYRHYGGRPTPLYFARRLTDHIGGAQIYLKREDLCHGGAHKFNNVMGQALLARRMGKKRVIAETGAGQHGVATAMVGAVLGLPVEVYMGAVDIQRQSLNVFRMKLLGAMGPFAPFLDEERVELLGAEAGGRGSSPGEHSASLTGGRVGVLHGARSYVLQDADGQVLDTHSISAGLDYPGVGPQLSFLKDTKRASFVAVTDEQALEGLHALAMYAGILPAKQGVRTC